MTEKTALPDPVSAAIDRALAAAQAATDAAHEAEAALGARAETAALVDRATRRMGWLSGLTGAVALVVIAGGAVLWLRSAADLRQTSELHAATGAAFVERLAEMNGALDRLDAAVARADAQATALDQTLAGLESRIDTQLQTVAQAMQADDPLRAEIARLREDLLAALAEVDLSVNRTLAISGNPDALAPVLQRLDEVTARLAAPAAAAPRPAAPAAETARPAVRKTAPARPAPRAASAAPSNPFRFP